MKNPTDYSTLTQVSLGAITLATLGLTAVQPVFAAPVSLLNPTIGGSAPGNFNLRCSVPAAPLPGNNVINCPGGTTLASVLTGGPGAPGGHVELNSITFGDPDLFTTLEGTLDGIPFSARSLMRSDWVNLDNTPTAFTTKFLTDALQVNGFAPTFFDPVNFATLTNTFITRGGPARFSDPNISYVFADSVTNDLTVGLAGIWNASNLLKVLFDGVVPPTLIPDVVQVSEAAFINYGTTSGYFYQMGGALPGTIPPSGPFFVGSSGQSFQNESIFCPGGGVSNVLSLQAGCSYTADFQLTNVVGGIPEQPYLPGTYTPGTNAANFVDVPVLQQPALTWFDPPAVTGYEFVASDPGTLFASIMLLPRLGSGAGSNEYDIFAGNDTCDAFGTSLGTATGGVEFFFPSPVNCFAIGGIDEGLGLGFDRYDPNNPNPGVPFPVGLTFAGNPETVSFTQTPVPEPLTLLGASAAVGFGSFFKRRRSQKG